MAETSDHITQAPLPFGQQEEPHLSDPVRLSASTVRSERITREDHELDRLRVIYSRASSSRAQHSTASAKPSNLLERVHFLIKRFWRHQISITVNHSACRDHLALERTFLGYLRTSLALSMMGIVVAQFFRLQHAPHPSPFGFFVLGKPMGCICQGSAIVTLFIGAFRTWRSQNAIVRGKAISGGFEIVLLAGGVFIILLVFLVLVIAVNVTKEDVT